MPRFPLLALGLSLPLLGACVGPNGFDFDFRGNSIANAVANSETAPRPEPDQFGLITYPTYQVAVARRGDTISDVANRIGMDGGELARFNGRNLGDALREGEVLALPRRVRPSASTAPAGTDIASIAGAAIDRADANSPATTASTPNLQVQSGSEPVQHQVGRGETAYSISRLYGVSVRSLAEWNGLGPDLTVRQGQYLIIPLVVEQVAAAPDGGRPGASVTPLPPSSAAPLPDRVQTAELPPAPDTRAPTPTPTETAAEIAPPAPQAQSQMQRPVAGSVARGYSASNERIEYTATAGSAVMAAADGEVAAITETTDQVPILVLRHPGNLLTIYANVANIRVARGDRVSRGQTVADVAAGNPARLYFEVRQGFEAVDPTPYFE